MSIETRHKAGIFSLKVLQFRADGKAIVKHPMEKGACLLLPVPDLGCQETGIYIDVRFSPTDGKRYKAVYQGVTLPEFVPSDGREIN